MQCVPFWVRIIAAKSIYHCMWSATVCNSYTMGCPPAHGDNPRALASGLSYIQVDKHGITILYQLISVDLAHHEYLLTVLKNGQCTLKTSYK